MFFRKLSKTQHEKDSSKTEHGEECWRVLKSRSRLKKRGRTFGSLNEKAQTRCSSRLSRVGSSEEARKDVGSNLSLSSPVPQSTPTQSRLDPLISIGPAWTLQASEFEATDLLSEISSYFKSELLLPGGRKENPREWGCVPSFLRRESSPHTPLFCFLLGQNTGAGSSGPS